MAVSQKLTITEVSVNREANTSEIRIVWKSTQTGDSHNNYLRSAIYWVKYNDGEETRYVKEYTLPQNYTETIVSHSLTAPHRPDGSGSVTVRTWMDTGISAGEVELTKTLELTRIARASTLEWMYSAVLGEKTPFVWTPGADYLWYKLKFTVGAWSHTTEAIHPNTTDLFKYYCPIPLEAASQITDYPEGKMDISLYTYLDEYATQQIGDASTRTITVKVPVIEDTEPYFEQLTVTAENPSSFNDDVKDLFIQGMSRVKVEASVKGRFGAHIIYYGVEVGGKTVVDEEVGEVDSFSCTSGYLNEYGTIDVDISITDSRFHDYMQTVQITSLAYQRPALLPASGESNVICARCDANGNLNNSGTYLKVKARRSYAKAMSGTTQNNFCSIRYRYVSESGQFEGDSGWTTILEGSNTSTDDVDVILLGGNLLPQTSYTVQVGVIDSFGMSDALQFIIPTEFVTIDIPDKHKGKRIGLFRYAKDTDEPGIDVDAPIYGGSIDSLLLGTKIAATADASVNLDDLLTPGCYYSPDKVTTDYISGAPENVDFGFGLEVRQMQSETNIRQTLYYGVTTWYRHWDGNEWSAWVSTLRGVSKDVIAHDFVVDSRVSGSWNCRLWQKGDAELWGRITLTYNDVRSLKAQVGLPFPFASKPIVNMTLSEATAYGHRQGSIVLSEVYVVNASAITLYLISDDGDMNADSRTEVSVTIRGKWK